MNFLVTVLDHGYRIDWSRQVPDGMRGSSKSIEYKTRIQEFSDVAADGKLEETLKAITTKIKEQENAERARRDGQGRALSRGRAAGTRTPGRIC